MSGMILNPFLTANNTIILFDWIQPLQKPTNNIQATKTNSNQTTQLPKFTKTINPIILEFIMNY